SARNNKDCSDLVDELFCKSKDFLEEYNKCKKVVPNMKCNELTFIIHRSGIERKFFNEQAYFLLREWQDILDLFSFEVKEQDIQNMNNNKIPDALQKEFKKKGINLQGNAKIYSEINDNEWTIRDRNKTYSIRKQNGELRVRDPSTTLISMNQLGYLSEFADRLLSESKEIGVNSTQESVIKKNLILDLHARSVGKKYEIIDRRLVEIIEDQIENYQSNKLEELPGFFREMGNLGKFPI
ncbi:MAG: hypothetical protein ACUVWN_10315, partial [bacterium]